MLDQIDYSAARFWFDVAHWAALIALGVWGYLRTKDKDNAEAVQKLAHELSTFIHATNQANEGQNTRLTMLEAAVEHMPNDEEIGRIREDVASTKTRVEAQSEQLRRIERQTEMIHRHLLGGGGA